jgi:hypothetical protein
VIRVPYACEGLLESFELELLGADDDRLPTATVHTCSAISLVVHSSALVKESPFFWYGNLRKQTRRDSLVIDPSSPKRL